MTRKNYCKACTFMKPFMKHGVKTRKSIPHTCDKINKILKSKNEKL